MNGSSIIIAGSDFQRKQTKCQISCVCKIQVSGFPRYFPQSFQWSHLYRFKRYTHPFTMVLTPAGRSSRAVIEFAPYQKVVKGKPKLDARQGTIESSPEYKEFLESLAQPAPSEQPVAPVQEEGVKTTPLIEYLRTQKSARAEKERINKEKMRLAKVAAVQAKANAQAEKLRAERLAKATENLAAKAAETGTKVAGRGGRGGRAGGKGKDVARAKTQAPQHKLAATTSNNGSNIEASASPVSTQSVPSVPPVGQPDEPGTSSSAGGAGGAGFRGGRGRGRGRPQGVYRAGGRGGRRGGAPPVGGNESKPSTGAEG